MILIIGLLGYNTPMRAQIVNDSVNVNNDSITTIRRNFMLKSLQNNLSVDKPDIIPSSPQSKVFEKYLNHPVTEYNGLAKIEIPLYQIEIKGLSIPITLSYHAGGVKYKQFDGEVGVGWSLNIGGYRVSRDVRGRADERFIKYDNSEFDKEVLNNYQYGRGDSYLGSIGFGDIHSQIPSIIVNGKFPYQDGEYDIFNYNLPSGAGKFVISDPNEYVPGTITSVTLLEENNDKIQPFTERLGGINNIVKFEINDENGFKYFFGGKENGLVVAEYPYHQVDPVNTAWPLREIQSPYNQIINFNYERLRTNTKKNKSQQLIITDAKSGAVYGSEGASDMAKIYVQEKKNYGYEYNDQYFIKDIRSEDFVIDIDRITGSDCDMINAINIYDSDNNLLKRIELEYSISSSHYVLGSVKISEKGKMSNKYSFEYYNNNNNGIDQWGYYCYQQNNYYVDMALHESLKNDGYTVKSSKTEPGGIGFVDNKSIKNTLNDHGKEVLRNCNWANRNENTNPNSFSLKKIIYPTGGFTEYIYEPHRYYGDGVITGGGQRIKQIISNAALDANPIITEYRYGENENGIGYPSVYFNQRDFASEDYFFDAISDEDYSKYVTRKYSTTPLNMSNEISEFNVTYDKVSVYQSDGIRYNGHTEMKYSIPRKYEQNPYEHLPFFDFNFDCIFPHPLNGVYSNYITGYNWSDRPLIESKKIYNSLSNIVLYERYYYCNIKQKSRIFPNVNVFQRLFGTSITQEYNQYGIQRTRYSLTNSFFDFNKYKIYSGKYDLLSKKEIITYDEKGDSILTNQKYEYNNRNQIIKETKINSSSGYVELTYTYPEDYPYGTETEIIEENVIFTEMVNQNIVSPIIEKATFNNGVEVGRVKTNYKKINNNIIVPSSIESSTSGSKMRTEITYDLYDKKGNILQYSTLNGMKFSYLWGYNYNYPIAEIQNASYDEIKNKLSISPDIIAQSIDPDISKIDALRSQLLGASVSTFKYKPFVGLILATNPAGLSTYYEYDDANRLEGIKDHNNNYIDFYKYNYANQLIKMYETLEILSLDVNDSYEMMETASFTTIVKGGSSNIQYEWCLYYWDNNWKEINTVTISSSNKVDFVLPFRGRGRIECNIIDLETGIKKSIASTFIVHSYLELKLSTGSQFSKYIMTDTETFTVTPSRGSGNYKYNWYLKDSSGNIILSQLNSSSNQFTVNFAKTQTGELTLFCLVKDMSTMKDEDISKTFEVDWLDLNMPLQTHYSVSKDVSSHTFEISVRGGSKNFRYDWYLSDENDQYISSMVNSLSNKFKVDFNSFGNMNLKCVVRDLGTGKSSKKESNFIVQKLISFIDLSESYNDYGSYSVNTVTGFIFNPYKEEKIQLYLNFNSSHKNNTRVEYRIGEQVHTIDCNSEQKTKYISISLPVGYIPIQMNLFKEMGLGYANMEIIIPEENTYTAVGEIGSIDIN